MNYSEFLELLADIIEDKVVNAKREISVYLCHVLNGYGTYPEVLVRDSLHERGIFLDEDSVNPHPHAQRLKDTIRSVEKSEKETFAHFLCRSNGHDSDVDVDDILINSYRVDWLRSEADRMVGK